VFVILPRRHFIKCTGNRKYKI